MDSIPNDAGPADTASRCRPGVASSIELIAALQEPSIGVQFPSRRCDSAHALSVCWYWLQPLCRASSAAGDQGACRAWAPAWAALEGW